MSEIISWLLVEWKICDLQYMWNYEFTDWMETLACFVVSFYFTIPLQIPQQILTSLHVNFNYETYKSTSIF